MSSKNSNLRESDGFVKKSSDKEMKNSLSKCNQKSFIEINKSNISKTVVKKDNKSKNPFINKSIKQTNVKKVELESRTVLVAKIDFLKEELERSEYEKSLITQELDRVCEQRDNQMRQLRSELHEKQLEIDHQICSFSENRNVLEEELNKYKQELQDLSVEFKQKETDLLSKNESLETQLSDLNDYIRNRDHTLAKIQELEQLVKQQKIFHNRTKEKLISELQNEKQKIGQLVDERVNELKQCMEESCLSKLSVDARIALKKFEELSENYQMSEKECGVLRKANESLKQKLYNQRINLEVSESLLHEMIKQMQRRLHNRKHIGIQSEDTSGQSQC